MKKAIFISIATYLIFFWQVLLPNYSFWKSDVQYTYIPARFYIHEKITQEGVFPFWTERMFNGFPIYADFENGYLNYINVFFILLFGPIWSYKILHILSYLVGSLCLYLWMKSKGLGILSFALANLIFFFNSFMINHQIHFNVIAAFYLFPSIIYLLDEIIKKLDIKKIFLLSIVISYIALWGHAQSTFLVCLGGLIYFAFHSYKVINFKKIFFTASLLGLLVLIQILPQYIPSLNLYQQSFRENEINYTQGSIIPRLAPIIFIPYLFGEVETYQAPIFIHKEYTYTEMYIYIGISSFLLAVFGFYLIKKDKLFFTLFTFIMLFFILSFNANNPFFNENTPIVSIFRYWQRSMILFSFAVAILAAVFLEKIKNTYLTKKDILSSSFYLLVPVIYLFAISFYIPEYYQSFVSEGVNRIKVLISFKGLPKIDNFEYILGIVTFISLITFAFYLLKDKIKFKYKEIIFSLAIALTVLFDLYFFNLDILDFRIDNLKKFKIPQIDSKYHHTRVVPRMLELNGMEHLYLKSWSPFGYSQFREEEYVKKFSESGLGNLRRSKVETPKDNFDGLRNYGIKYFLLSNEEIITTTKEIELIKEEVKGKYLQKNEGHIEMQVESNSKQNVTLLLKHNNNWEITNNNIPISYQKEGIFMKIEINEGINYLKIKYIPREFYIGIFSSLVLLIPVGLLIRFKNKFIG